MDDWKVKRLGDIATYVNGYAFKPSDWKLKGLPIIRIQNLTGSSSEVNYYDGDKVPSKYVVEDGDVLISWSASLGVYEWKGGQALLNQHIFKVVFDKFKIDKGFFMLTISRSLDEMIRHTHGSTMKHITKKNFDNIQVPVPPKTTQKKIAALLLQARHIISQRQAQIEKLDLLIKSQFIQMFGDPVSNPHGWKRVTLADIATITSSKRIFESEYVNEGVPFYRTKEIVELSKGNLISTELFISNERYDNIKTRDGVPKEGDLLISAVGTIGVIWIVNISTPFYFKDGNLLWLKCGKMCNPVFMKFLLSSLITYYQKTITAGSAYKALTIVKLKQMQTHNPPMYLQQQFADFVRQVEQQKALLQQSLTKMEENYKSLMQKCFRGEIFS